MTAAAPLDAVPPVGAPVLAARGVVKRYGGTHALRGVDAEFRSGVVHAIVGENGAGKSTLTRILTGAASADSGTILIDGAPARLRTPLDGQRLGIRMVHQHDTLAPNLTVTENILLGHMPRSPRTGWIDWGSAHRRAAEVLAEIGWPELDIRRFARDLPVSQRQIVEIAKATSIAPRVLILDEPTAALAHDDIARLFAFIRKLRDGGAAILYISHRLDEIFDIANHVTVLRDGAVTGSLPTRDVDKAGLIRLMVGRAIQDMFPRRAVRPAEPALVVRDLTRAGAFRGVSFHVAGGEIVGMYGLVGSGRTEVARCLFGADRATGGAMTWRGRPFAPGKPCDALSAGIALLTEDRLGDGLVPGMSVRDNASLASLAALSRFGVLNVARQIEAVERQVQSLAVRPSGIERDVATLSGGNQQKLVLAKWLLTEAKLLILDEPTRGVDVAAKQDIYGLIGRLAEAGIAVLLISSDLPEIIGMSDRILVMREGHLAGAFARAQASEELLLACASGLPTMGERHQ
jgi:ABC-type sugar transport system ATPase subunit